VDRQSVAFPRNWFNFHDFMNFTTESHTPAKPQPKKDALPRTKRFLEKLETRNLQLEVFSLRPLRALREICLFSSFLSFLRLGS
jgi:hypothetical protein